MSFATRLKTLRAEHHMTQKELASRMNLCPNHDHRIRNEKTASLLTKSWQTWLPFSV